MIEVVRGNLLLTDANVICQQVNCKGVMGAGLAKTIAAKYPIVKTQYQSFCRVVNDSNKLLGKVLIVKHETIPYDVANIFGQLTYGRERGVTYTDYDALECAFLQINKLYRYHEKTIAFPWEFGCGLAKGNWSIVMRLMLECLSDCSVKVYVM